MAVNENKAVYFRDFGVTAYYSKSFSDYIQQSNINFLVIPERRHLDDEQQSQEVFIVTTFESFFTSSQPINNKGFFHITGENVLHQVADYRRDGAGLVRILLSQSPEPVRWPI